MIDIEFEAGTTAFATRSRRSRSTAFDPSSDTVAGIVGESQFPALTRAIEDKVIPRLLLAHRLDGKHRANDASAKNETIRNCVLEFTRIVSTQSNESIRSYVSALLAKGMTIETVFLDVLSPTADHFGELWCSDDCGFFEVTLVLCKLQNILRDFGHGTVTTPQKRDHRILLAPVPSDQHTFGMLMVEAFFRRSGWSVVGLPAATAKETVDTVRRNWFAVVGLSMSNDAYAPKLPALISTLRKVSRNPSILVLVGGHYFNENPEQAAIVGADTTAADARHAVVQSQRALTAVGRHH